MVFQTFRSGVQRRQSHQRGQSLVEFAISSIVLLLLMMGLLDLSRAFYFAINLQGAAREAARHGAWFDTASRSNIYLSDSEVLSVVRSELLGAGLPASSINLVSGVGCLSSTDGNSLNNKPYPSSAFPTTPQTVSVYVCYSPPSGAPVSTRASAPSDNSWRLGDINVSLLMNFQLITPFIQSIFGNGINVAYNEHFTIQGKP